MKENEKPIEDYNFSLKKDEIKKIFNTSDYQEYKKNKIKTQKRKEKIYKFTSIGNSTNIIRNLIIINTILFVMSVYFIPMMINHFAIFPIWSANFKIWQPITSMFLHGGWLHLILNMFVLWSFGNQIVDLIGSKKFLYIYLISGIFGGILWMFFGTGPAVGASGALCGLIATYIFIAPETEVLLFFFIPIKIKKFVYGFALFSLIFGLMSMINPAFGFGIGHFAHLGGLIGGYLITYYWKNKKLIPTF